MTSGRDVSMLCIGLVVPSFLLHHPGQPQGLARPSNFHQKPLASHPGDQPLLASCWNPAEDALVAFNAH